MELQKHDHPDVQAIVADLVDIASDIQNMGIGDGGDEMMSPMDGFPGDDLEGMDGEGPDDGVMEEAPGFPGGDEAETEASEDLNQGQEWDLSGQQGGGPDESVQDEYGPADESYSLSTTTPSAPLSSSPEPLQRHAHSFGGNRQDTDPVAQAFIKGGFEQQRRRERADRKRRQRRKGQGQERKAAGRGLGAPTSKAPAGAGSQRKPAMKTFDQALGVERYVVPVDHLGRYVAPPGKEEMVKKLKKKEGVDNPYAVAWAVHNKSKQRHNMVHGGITDLGPAQDAYERNYGGLRYIVEQGSGVDPAVVDRMYHDAVASLDTAFKGEGADAFKQVWRHLLDEARDDALQAASGQRSHDLPKSMHGTFSYPVLPDFGPGGQGKLDRYVAPAGAGDPNEEPPGTGDGDDGQGVTVSSDRRFETALQEKDYDQEEVQGEVTGEGAGIPKRETETQYTLDEDREFYDALGAMEEGVLRFMHKDKKAEDEAKMVKGTASGTHPRKRKKKHHHVAD